MCVLHSFKLSTISGVCHRTAGGKDGNWRAVKPNTKIWLAIQRVHRNVEEKWRERQDHSEDTTEKAEYFNLEAGQVVFHISEHITEHKREPKHIKKDA